MGVLPALLSLAFPLADGLAAPDRAGQGLVHQSGDLLVEIGLDRRKGGDLGGCDAWRRRRASRGRRADGAFQRRRSGLNLGAQMEQGIAPLPVQVELEMEVGAGREA